MATESPLDLHAIATLLNYELASTDPRFRHAKLRECHFSSTGELALDSVPQAMSQLTRKREAPTRGYVFESVDEPKDTRDLPSNMLSDQLRHPSVDKLSEDELEAIYWEVRGHDGCYRTVTTLQHFFDLFPKGHPLRIRTADGEDFLSDIDSRIILEFDLYMPLQITYIATSGGKRFTTGDQARMNHAVWGFGRPGEEMVGITLDMASMQFGEKGRGKGGETFMLGTMDAFYDFIETVVKGGDPMKELGSKRIGPSTQDKWLKEVAARVKDRWMKRESERWCDYCGKPLDTPKACPCKEVFYCGAGHQKKAWKYHKKHCVTKKKDK